MGDGTARRRMLNRNVVNLFKRRHLPLMLFLSFRFPCAFLLPVPASFFTGFLPLLLFNSSTNPLSAFIGCCDPLHVQSSAVNDAILTATVCVLCSA